jgi:NADPH:quinone reductase-like Zn-dependent oxidoreductase
MPDKFQESSMKAIVYDRFGPVEVLHAAELPTPTAAKGQVVVKMRVSSINVIDSRVRKGLMGLLVNKKFPKTPGADVAGTVAEVGPGVTNLKIGDEVFGAVDPMKGGALAEFVVVPAGQLAAKPPSLSFEEAAALPIAGLAALLALRDLGKTKAGDKVLIHGASGAVGLFAVQIAKHLGARVTAVAGTGGIAASKSAGADEIIDYRKQDGQTFATTFDVILNASGQMPWAKAKRYLTAGGTLIEPSPTIPMVIGSTLANLLRAKKHKTLITTPRRADLETLAAMISKGGLKPTIARVYPLAAAKEAFAAMEKGGVVGKLIVTMT